MMNFKMYNTFDKNATIRGEHLQNLLDYLDGNKLKWDGSKGYSSAFAEKHDEILKDIIENPEKLVKVVSALDDICNCGLCPKKGEDCESNNSKENDKIVAAKYGITINSEYSSETLIQLLMKKKNISKSFLWKLCTKFLRRF
jgi:hypothetical protein